MALLTIVGLALLAATATGAFFLGQSTRKSDGQVAAMTTRAVRAETARQEDTRRKALDERKERDRATLRRVVKKIKTQAKRQAEQSYAAGQSVRYTSGHSAGEQKGEKEGYQAGSIDGYVDGSSDGYESGLTDGSDELDCSDDPDVDWLPPCY